MDFKIDEVIENIRVVDQYRDYWFIRSYSGKLFDEYYEGNFIGLGFNAIPYNYIKEASKADEATFNRLKTSLANQYNLQGGETTRWANQLIDFEKGVKIGDMVIMPSENSQEYAFGLIESDTKVSKSNRTFQFKEGFEPIPEKRKTVKWLKKIDRDDLNGDLIALSSTRMPLVNAFRYREAIEGNLSTVYIKEGKLYLTIQINQEEDINAFAFNEFLSSLTYFYKELCIANNEEYDEELFLKIKVQSKGKMALKALKIAAGVGLSGLVLLANNPELKIDVGSKFHFDAKSEGGLSSLTKFLNASDERKMRMQKFQDSMKKLQATPVPKSVSPKEDHAHDTHLKVVKTTNIQIVEAKEDEITSPSDSSHKDVIKKPDENGQQKD